MTLLFNIAIDVGCVRIYQIVRYRYGAFIFFIGRQDNLADIDYTYAGWATDAIISC